MPDIVKMDLIPFQDYLKAEFNKIDISDYIYYGLFSKDCKYIFVTETLYKNIYSIVKDYGYKLSGTMAKEMLITLYAKYFKNFSTDIYGILFTSQNTYRID
ncbi:MAG: hypothetical protein AB7V16_12790 [Vulcanibacillus sp.]